MLQRDIRVIHAIMNDKIFRCRYAKYVVIQVKLLTMLGMYLDTSIIDHKYCSMLSILNELTLRKE